jgi:hypothetical protein
MPSKNSSLLVEITHLISHTSTEVCSWCVLGVSGVFGVLGEVFYLYVIGVKVSRYFIMGIQMNDLTLIVCLKHYGHSNERPYINCVP